MIVRMKQPFAGKIEVYGSPFKMSQTPGCVRGYTPLLGEHSREILATMLGYGDEDIDTLFKEGVAYQEQTVDRLGEELERSARD